MADFSFVAGEPTPGHDTEQESWVRLPGKTEWIKSSPHGGLFRGNDEDDADRAAVSLPERGVRCRDRGKESLD
jgi:hypothetical protein